jgi:hypothetical protein
MMKLADLYCILVEAGKDALGHEFDVIDPGWQFKAVELSEFL